MLFTGWTYRHTAGDLKNKKNTKIQPPPQGTWLISRNARTRTQSQLTLVGVRAPSLAGGDSPERRSSPAPLVPLATAAAVATAALDASWRPGCVICGIRSPMKVESMPPASEESRCCSTISVRLTSHSRLKTLRSRPCSTKHADGGKKRLEVFGEHASEDSKGKKRRDLNAPPAWRLPSFFRRGKPTTVVGDGRHLKIGRPRVRLLH